MAIISFIEKREQPDVIEKILNHCGLWDRPATRAPPEKDQSADEQSVLDRAERDPERPCNSKGCRVLRGREYVVVDEFLMAL